MKRLQLKRTGRLVPVVRHLLLMAGAAALLIAPCVAQAQTQNEMTIPEFRQVLVDLGTYLDAHKGTNLASQFSALSDEALSNIYPHVVNPQQLKNAVAALKEHDAALANGSPLAPRRSSAPRAQVTPNAGVGNGCGTDVIINDSTTCAPAYPDPSNTAWQNLVNPLITFGAFSPSDYASVSSQSCGLTVESNLVQVVAALNGTVTVAAIACGALPPVASNVCFGVVAGIGVAGAVSQGLLADCSEQDGNVNAAEIDAGYHNTVTIYDGLNTGFANASTQLTNVNTQITGEFTTAATQLTNVNTQITGEFSALSTQVANVDTHLTNVDTHIANEFATLTGVVNQATAQLNAELKQIMKLELTPEGLRKIDPPILTCTGTNCPNVLAACPAAGCSWNNAGPLP